MKRIKVLIADDHRIVREGLVAILKTKDGLDLVGEATNGIEAIEKTKRLKPDVVLMDISMPKMNGIKATRALKKMLPQIGIVALTMHDDDKTIFELVSAGVDGYLLKDSESDKICSAIREIFKGGSIMHPHIAKKVLSAMSHMPPPPQTKKPKHANRYRLSVREIEVLKEVARGRSNKEIGNVMKLSEKTIKNHLRSIFSKLEVNDRTKAAIIGIQEGFIDLARDLS